MQRIDQIDRTLSVPRGIQRARLDKPRIARGNYGTIGFGTDHGGRKPPNESRLVVDMERNGFVVIDGMGGAKSDDGKKGGKEAAEVIAGVFTDEFLRGNCDMDRAGKNAHVKLACEGFDGAGACHLAAVFDHENLSIFYTGDVRLIILDENGKVIFRTKDKKIRKKKGTNPDGSPKWKQYVTSAINGNSYHPTSNEFQGLRNGMRIIAADDGLWGNLSPSEVAKLVHGKSVREALAVIDKALQKKMAQSGGYHDNRAVLLYWMEQVQETTPEEMLEQVESREQLFAALTRMGVVVEEGTRYTPEALMAAINPVLDDPSGFDPGLDSLVLPQSIGDHI